MTHDDALPALPIGEAEVLWHEPDPVMPERPGKIIDASYAFMDAAPLGTRLYSAEQMRAYVRADRAAHAEPVARVGRDGYSVTLEPAAGTLDAVRRLDALPDGALLYAAAPALPPGAREAMRMAADALDESRDDVNEVLNGYLPHAGYSKYDWRIKQTREQLAKHDAAIDALRLWLREEK